MSDKDQPTAQDHTEGAQEHNGADAAEDSPVAKVAAGATGPLVDDSQFKEKTRVKRKHGSPCLGTISRVRQELRPSSAKGEFSGLLLEVLWDNGTQSYMAPEAVEAVS